MTLSQNLRLDWRQL